LKNPPSKSRNSLVGTNNCADNPSGLINSLHLAAAWSKSTGSVRNMPSNTRGQNKGGFKVALRLRRFHGNPKTEVMSSSNKVNITS
jgi:hypothetical protein